MATRVATTRVPRRTVVRAVLAVLAVIVVQQVFVHLALPTAAPQPRVVGDEAQPHAAAVSAAVVSPTAPVVIEGVAELGLMNWDGRSTVPVVVVCHRHWHGIRAASEALGFPLAMRDDQSGKAWDDTFLRVIALARVRKVLINGIPPGSMQLAQQLRAANVTVYVSYHGSFVQHIGNTPEMTAFADVHEAVRRGDVSRLGLVKVDMVHVMRDMGVDAWPVMNLVDVSGVTIAPKFGMFDGMAHIGVLGGRTFGKNVVTQLMAACTVPNAVVHVLRLEENLPYLNACPAPIVQHNPMSHDVFRRLLSQMDANLYVSLHECQPMVAFESIAAGVPCVISDTSRIYESDPDIEQTLMCGRHDSADAIHECVKRALTRSEPGRLRAYASYFNEAACRSMAEFLDEPVQALFRPGQCECNNDCVKFYGGKNGHPSSLPGASAAATAPWLQQPQVSAAKSIMFVTYELGGTTPGGAGALIGSLAVLLAESGVRVVVLADLPRTVCNEWRTAGGGREKVELASLAEFAMPEDGTDVFVAKSHQWASGVASAWRKFRVDTVEFFEYAGAASELLAHRGDYLPADVRVIVRAHGSLEIIDAAEGAPAEARLRMYAMERTALSLADAVLFPTRAMAEFYRRATGIVPRATIVAQPPVDVSDFSSGACSKPLAGPTFHFLVLGKVQRIKNPGLVARATVRLLRRGVDVSVTFAGMSFVSVEGQPDPVADVLSNVPDDLRDKFTFIGAVARADLPDFVRCYGAGIVASSYESFNLVAHELYAAHVPLVISDFDAFAEFFHDGNAFVFRRGSVASLSEAMYRATLPRMSLPSPISYSDPVAAYSALPLPAQP